MKNSKDPKESHIIILAQINGDFYPYSTNRFSRSASELRWMARTTCWSCPILVSHGGLKRIWGHLLSNIDLSYWIKKFFCLSIRTSRSVTCRVGPLVPRLLVAAPSMAFCCSSPQCCLSICVKCSNCGPITASRCWSCKGKTVYVKYVFLWAKFIIWLIRNSKVQAADPNGRESFYYIKENSDLSECWFFAIY